MTSETGPDPGAASSARDEAVRVIVAAIAAAPWASEGEGASSYVRAGVDALIARPDVLAALAAEAGLVVLDGRTPTGSVQIAKLADTARLHDALHDALEGLEDMRPYVPDYFADKWDHDGYVNRARAALNLAGERTR